MRIRWNEPLGDPECPYLRRWAVDFGPFAVRLHHWYRSDDKRAPHTHPWWFVTLVLRGAYDDWSYPPHPDAEIAFVERASGAVLEIPDLENRIVDHLHAGSVRFRPADHVHSVAVRPGGCWTLMVSGRPSRKWGFWTRRADGSPRFKRSNKYFMEDGHHPCDQL